MFGPGFQEGQRAREASRAEGAAAQASESLPTLDYLDTLNAVPLERGAVDRRFGELELSGSVSGSPDDVFRLPGLGRSQSAAPRPTKHFPAWWKGEAVRNDGLQHPRGISWRKAFSEPERQRVEPVTAAHQGDGSPFKPLIGLFRFIAITFFLVSAGPYGMEEAIGSGGALLLFVFTLLIPFLFSLPMALMSAELSTLFPLTGSAVEWTGDMGFQVTCLNSYTRFLRSWIDNAMYPVSVADYLVMLAPWLSPLWARFLVGLACLVLCVFLNVLGLEIVGAASIILMIVVLAPFVLFVAFAAPSMTADKLFTRPDFSTVQWAGLISTLIWQFSGFDTVAAVAAEVKKPHRTFPLGLTLSAALVTLVYLLPSLAGAAVDPDQSHWVNGYFSDASRLLPYCSNGWLAIWISVAGSLSTLSILNVALGCTGRELYAMAKFRVVPFSDWLLHTRTTRKGGPVPVRAILVQAVLVLPLCLTEFSFLVQVNGLLTAACLVMQISAYIYARHGKNGIAQRIADGRHEDTTQDKNRTFVVRGGAWGTAALCTPALLVCLTMILVSGWEALLGSATLLGLCYALYYIDRWVSSCARRRQQRRQSDSGSMAAQSTPYPSGVRPHECDRLGRRHSCFPHRAPKKSRPRTIETHEMYEPSESSLTSALGVSGDWSTGPKPTFPGTEPSCSATLSADADAVTLLAGGSGYTSHHGSRFE